MTRKRTDTHTIQLWPGGQSIEYRGDPDGPKNQRSLRDGHYQDHIRCTAGCVMGPWGHHKRVKVHLGPDKKLCNSCAGSGWVKNPTAHHWRKGTPDEWRQIRINLRAEIYWRNEGKGCDSALVDDLIKAANCGSWGRDEVQDLARAFSYDEIRNLYADPSEWDAARCREYAENNGIYLDVTEPPRVPCEVHAADPDNSTGALTRCKACALDDDDPDYLSELRDACREHSQDNPAEVFEWWRVSEWLCKQLHAIGEVTIDNGYGCWWGRCTTGQGLIMDGVLQRIAAQFEKEEEQ
jgi:hypothetical protein